MSAEVVKVLWYSKSKPLVSLIQSLDHVYDDLGDDEDTHLHCLDSTQHSCILDPS